MVQYPSPSEIINFVKNPVFIHDLVIKGGQIVTSATGVPERYTGGFAITFKFKIGDDLWAFRCWHNGIENAEDRYAKFSKIVEADKLPYFCEFHFEKDGMFIPGALNNPYPTTRMRWVEGDNFKDYICKHRDKEKLLALAEKFKKMCIDLHDARLSHGDLQEGNIKVNEEQEIFLIDYDSMYHPSMGQMEMSTAGLHNYQHPQRGKCLYSSEKDDYFSEIIIYLTILAVAYKPSILDEYNIVPGSDTTLFTVDDFRNITASKIYNELKALDPVFEKPLEILETYLRATDFSKLDFFVDLLDTKPSISLSSDKSFVMIGRQTPVTLSWKIKNTTNAALYRGSVLVKEISANGSITLNFRRF